MPRPRKERRVCGLPGSCEFLPSDGQSSAGPVVISLDEYETIRLIDREGFSQEMCSESMQVARTTVQQIYSCARRKLADAIVEGRAILVGGGNYSFCDGSNPNCPKKSCPKQQYRYKKGDNTMRIAVTYMDGAVFQHFGHTEQFKVYDVENGAVIAARVVDAGGSGHGALAGLLASMGVDALICGGIGGGAQRALATAGIKLYAGVQGDADGAVEALIGGSLAFDPEANCDHHGEHHHGDHDCGDHGCGDHGCGDHGCHH